MLVQLPRSIDKWLLPYLLRKKDNETVAQHVILTICDHFEPFHKADSLTAMKRVKAWRDGLLRLTSNFSDSSGTPVRHTFFYPVEQYDSNILSILSDLGQSTGCETEIHLHHHNDTPENLRSTLASAKTKMARQNLLSTCPDGNIVFGFIHGNWALADCDPRGINCGVTGEIDILKETGCYADFTMPSAPHPTQPKTINSIYYAKANVNKPLENGSPASIKKPNQQGLLMVQGPLGLNWHNRKWGILPRIDNGALTGVNPPTLKRMQIWKNLGIQVEGMPDWTFIKLYTHGALPPNQNMLLGNPMEQFYSSLHELSRSSCGPDIHFATAREMVNMIHAAEDGMNGCPNDYRNYRYQKVRTD